MPTRTGPPTVAGRWSRLPERDTDTTRRTHALAEALLDRHGVVTRGAVVAERAPGGFAAVYTVLKAFEEAGRVRRGYFVEGLGRRAVRRPRRGRPHARARRRYAGVRRAAVGDAGARAAGTSRPAASASAATRRALWCSPRPTRPTRTARPSPGPSREGARRRQGGRAQAGAQGRRTRRARRRGARALRRARRQDAAVVHAEESCLPPAVDALALAVRDGALGKMTVTKADGEAALTSPLGLALEAAGFRPTPRGLRLRA